jgi:pyruvate/2-oxoglutarate dehydrogenase complex dihydrolipoamide acyltransferase (E2) component
MQLYLPKLGMAMAEGTIAQWLVADGDRVVVGQPIYVIDADKVEAEVESQVEGTIHLIATAGTTYEVGAVVAEVDPA